MPVCRSPVRVHVVDPSAYTPPYDHALCARARPRGRRRRAGDEPLRLRRRCRAPTATRVERALLPLAPRRRRLARCGCAAKLAQHVPDMLRYAPRAARGADVVHFQWLTRPAARRPPAAAPRARPLVLTAHDVLPREPRPRPARRASGACTSASTPSSSTPSTAPRGCATSSAIDPGEGPRDPARRVRAPRRAADARRCRPSWPPSRERPVVLLLRAAAPVQGHRRAAGGVARASTDAELWIVGLPRMDIAPLRAAAPPNVRFVPRFVADDEIAGVLPPRRPRRAALPRDRPVRRALHRARVRHAAAARAPSAASPRSPRRARPSSSPPGDPAALARGARPPARRPGRPRPPRRRRPRGRRRPLLLGRDRASSTSRSTGSLLTT